MKTKKQIVFRLLFAIEVIVYGCIYLFSEYGIITCMQKHNDTYLKNTIAHLQSEIIILNNLIESYKGNSFFREKIAREKMQMVQKGEYIFWYTDQEN